MNKEFKEIGELLFEVIDSIEREYKKKSEKQNIHDLHYLDRIIHKTTVYNKYFWELLEKIKTHQKISMAASDVFIKLELSPYLSIAENMVEIVAEVLIKIRNNLFHGRKVYNDKEDRNLLQLINPIICEIIKDCENRDEISD